ncbi:MAG: hypothetical protein K2X36_11785 [Microbacteriaceae bacterium]|nr:hypothetical protein [Microbacteriaceae bacterium]
MRKHTITDAEAQQLLSGATPEGRSELAELAASIADVRRDASQLAAPQPSAALAARLDQPALGVSAGSEPTPLKGIKKMAASLAGLSLAAKLAAATGVLALGLTGVGAAGALPGPAQDAFDGVISSFTATEDEVVDDGAAEECVVDDGTVDDGTVDEGTDGTTDDELYGATDEGTVEDGTDEGTVDEGTVDDGTDTEECADDLPVGSGEFSDWVKQGAQDPDKVGAEFGAAVSEQARELKNQKAEERVANGGNNGNGNGQGGGDDDADDEGDDETVDETSTGNGKPAGTPGGGRP